MSIDLDDLNPDDLALDDLTEFDDLRALMTRAVVDLDVPTHRLGDRARLDGRRLRRRRRGLAAAGGLAAAATIAAFALPLAGGSGNTATDPGYAGPPTATPTGVEPPMPFVARPGYWDMPVAEMAGRLTGLLPERVRLTAYEKTNTDHAPGEPDTFIGYLLGTLGTHAGPGGVNVFLRQLPADSVVDATPLDDADGDGTADGCPPEVSSPDVQVQVCSIQRDASGRVVQRELETVYQGVTVREVRLVTHGGMVYVSVANSTGYKWATPSSASTPPLTLDQLADIATSPTWTSWTPSGR